MPNEENSASKILAKSISFEDIFIAIIYHVYHYIFPVNGRIFSEI